MKKIISTIILSTNLFFAQSISQKLDKAVKELMNSEPAYSANLSMFVANFDGKMVYEFNGNKGLSTASTQKIFTAACVLETLGKNYKYKTTASFSDGNLYLFSNGDPTLGSWRYDGFKPEDFKKFLIESLKSKNISKIQNLVIDDSYFDFQTVPGGWPWNDMGNYYGSGVWSVNWRENQFDINMNGNSIKNFNIDFDDVKFVNDIKTGGSSDKSLIFTAPHSNVAYLNGTLPAKNITISGSMPNPPHQLGLEIKDWLSENGIEFSGKIITVSEQKITGDKISKIPQNAIIFEYESPTLDKIVYWFLRKSVNLYGETFIKTLGKEKRNSGSFDAGVNFLQDFWKSKGINGVMINFADGSGLSPQNYVSARAEVQALLYAQKQNWFDAYYDGFPVHKNGMKMKSGTMKNTKSFAGIYKNYVFSIIINNYQSANSGEALEKVLNVLK